MPNQITSFSSVSIKGVFNYKRARVLWYDGLLRVYTVDGLRLEVIAEQPSPRPGYLRSWTVRTDKGDIILRRRCVTCGGKEWRRLAYRSTNELWRMVA